MAVDIPVTFIDNPHAPEVLATAHSGIWFYEGDVHITLEAVRMDYSKQEGPVGVNRVVIGRVAMPTQAAINLAKHILQMAENPQTPAPAPPTASYH